MALLLFSAPNSVTSRIPPRPVRTMMYCGPQRVDGRWVEVPPHRRAIGQSGPERSAAEGMSPPS